MLNSGTVNSGTAITVNSGTAIKVNSVSELRDSHQN